MIRRLLVLFTCLLSFVACSSDDGDPATDTVADTAAADTVAADAADTSATTTDTTAGDSDGAGSAVYPNLSEVLGFPWGTGDSPMPNAAWQSTCAAELPTNTAPSRPPMPANPSNCAGDSTKCGSGGTRDCAAEPQASAWLHRVTLDTATYPDAVCNDGSPGLLEVRAGTGNGANRWLFWFKGGSSCANQHFCARRWCGNQSGSKYTAAIMSSDWNGDGKVDRPHCVRPDSGSALDKDLAGNPFANANIVKIWYCGSDTHRGRATVDHVDTDPDGDGVERSFSVETKGRRIVEAALATLDAGVTSDDGVVTLPSLTDATFVVISGSSAGSMGAMQNLDAMHEHIVGIAPTAVVRGVLDANVPPSDDVLESFGVYMDLAFDEMQTPGVLFSEWRRQAALSSWTDGWNKAADVFVDQSCQAHIAATAGDSGMHTCLAAASLLLARDGAGPVIDTPTFVRYDLGDGVVGGAYKPCEDRATGDPCYTPNHSFLSYEDANATTWLNLADSSDHNRATMIQLFDSNTSVSGIFAPACGTHTGFTNNNYTQQSARDYHDGAFRGPRANFMEVLTEWLVNGTRVRVIDASKSEPDAPGAQCDGSPG